MYHILSIASAMNGIRCVRTNVDDDGDALRDEFNNFLSQLMTAMSDKNEQEEISILNSRWTSHHYMFMDISVC